MLCLLAQWPAGKQRKTLIKKVISQRVKIAGHRSLRGGGGGSHAPPLVKDTRKKVLLKGTGPSNERMATRLPAHVCTGLFKYLQRRGSGELTVRGFVKMQFS